MWLYLILSRNLYYTCNKIRTLKIPPHITRLGTLHKKLHAPQHSAVAREAFCFFGLCDRRYC